MFQVIYNDQDKYFKVRDLKSEKTLVIQTVLVSDTYLINGADIRFAIQERKDEVEVFSISGGVVRLDLDHDIKVLNAKLVIIDKSITGE